MSKQQLDDSNSESQSLKAEASGEDSLQFLWAVSYCDLLMVLVSFLILFFQATDAKTSTSVLNNVILSLKGNVSAEAPVITEANPQAAPSATPHAVPAPDVLDELAQTLNGDHVKVVKDIAGKSIVMDLDDNLYAPGAYAFPEQDMKHFQDVLSRILPYSKDIFITFVGHADEKKILHTHGAIIDSNLVLSNLRAARAVEIAYKLGFDPKTVTGQGAGEFSRDTRSLSIKVTERASK